MIIKYNEFLLEGKKPTINVPSLTNIPYMLNVDLNQLKFHDEKQLKIILNKFSQNINTPTKSLFGSEEEMIKLIRRVGLKWNFHKGYDPISFIDLKYDNKSWYFALLPDSRYKFKTDEDYAMKYSTLPEELKTKAIEVRKKAEQYFFELSKSLEYLNDIKIENLYPITPSIMMDIFGIKN
jgi:hypothetical protein